jgi:deazaflavin-dependent oxidoreductase (nitroreductase family)
MLRSPLHRFMGNAMLLTVSGRKSGRPITTPVNFHRSGQTLWILSHRDRKWWRNISSASPVTLHLDGEDLPGSADLVLDDASVAEQLEAYIQSIPGAARPLGIRIVGGLPDQQDLQRAAQERLFVKICVG